MAFLAKNERYKFYKRVQQPGESINVYLSELRKLGVTCKFTDLNTSLRDQLVVGIRSETAQKRLFLEDDNLTLDNAVKIATSQEAADSSTQLIRQNNSHVVATNQTNKVKLSSKQSHPNKSKQNKFKCIGCGGKHQKKDCPHKEVICHRCNKSGHFANRCLSQLKGEGAEGKYKTSQIKNVKQVPYDSPIIINVRLNGISTDLELDTASGTSFITPNIWKKLGCPKLRPSNKRFRTYTGQKFESRGIFLCTVEYNQQTVKHQIHVSEGSSLFGRDLLRKIQIDWTLIKKQCSQEILSVQ
ncbi:PREDICTED: uncharacterized protein K02A2.6-like [Wasmannia auropunctata]|uniref:uncharacterized protein K02A2.6-like n=1 Tax=Wasmannia auropunctata TaxID=64793 RepID=UPI0005EEE9E2|nr:PREDICTED: uncharacterized protein K02A2.6-like [Wasmannia auropunctata]